MKRTAIVTLLVLLQVAPPVPKKAESSGSKDSNSRHSKSADSQPPPLAADHRTVEERPESAPLEASQNENQPVVVQVLRVDVRKDWADYLYIATGLLLTLITLGIAVIALKQANAAKASAEAVTTSERAWVIITPRTWNPGLAIVPAQGGPIPLNVFEASIKNIGRTPAQLIEIALRYVTLGSLQDLPETPDYGPTGKQDGMLLVPEDSILNIAPLGPSPSLTQDEARVISNRQRLLYAYGFVSYKDAFGRSRESRYGYEYYFPQGLQVSLEQPTFRRAGPPEYNKAT